MTEMIIKQDTRIFTPKEYESLRAAMVPEPGARDISYYPLICDAMLFSGMRPIEFKRFQPDWYKASRRLIKLPDGACQKQKCEFKERSIILSLPGCDAFDRLVSSTVRFKKKMVPVLEMRPEKVSFGSTLKRYAIKAGIGDKGVCPKSFRKTWVSWLVACFPEKSIYIQASMGHDQDTIVGNYIGLGFTREETEVMRDKCLVGWGELV
jgi:integrase